MVATGRGNEKRREKLDLRLTPTAKQTLHQTPAAAERSVSDFVLDSALARAAETLADRQQFNLTPERWQAFLVALDTPPHPPQPRLATLHNEPSVFER